jgi:hypothetical protein
MPTTTTKTEPETPARGAYLAALGASQLVIEAGRRVSGDVVTYAQGGRSSIDGTFRGLVERGARLEHSIRSSATTKRAVDQTKVARSRVKAATTSVRKAVSSSAQASKAAAGKLTSKKAS